MGTNQGYDRSAKGGDGPKVTITSMTSTALLYACPVTGYMEVGVPIIDGHPNGTVAVVSGTHTLLGADGKPHTIYVQRRIHYRTGVQVRVDEDDPESEVLQDPMWKNLSMQDKLKHFPYSCEFAVDPSNEDFTARPIRGYAEVNAELLRKALTIGDKKPRAELIGKVRFAVPKGNRSVMAFGLAYKLDPEDAFVLGCELSEVKFDGKLHRGVVVLSHSALANIMFNDAPELRPHDSVDDKYTYVDLIKSVDVVRKASFADARLFVSREETKLVWEDDVNGKAHINVKASNFVRAWTFGRSDDFSEVVRIARAEAMANSPIAQGSAFSADDEDEVVITVKGAKRSTATATQPGMSTGTYGGPATWGSRMSGSGIAAARNLVGRSDSGYADWKGVSGDDKP